MIFLDSATYPQWRPALARLYSASFHREMPDATLAWRYQQNPMNDFLVAVEEDGPELAASYSASPCRLASPDGVIRTALSLDTMTHPSHAGKGLFTTLAEATYSEMARRGYSAIWGFPNFQSHPGFVTRLGWRDIYEIPTMRLEAPKPSRSPSGVLEDDRFELDYDGAGDASPLLRVEKSAPYLKWRYRDNPRHRYSNSVVASGGRVSSFLVSKTFGEEMDLIDLQAADATEAGALLDSALARAAAESRKAVNAWAPRHHLLHRLLEKRGFRLREPVTYFGARAFSEIRPDWTRFDSWYLQMGDSDVF